LLCVYLFYRYISVLMNIFVLDENTLSCARMHNDRHVVKMILETAQLLCSAHHSTGSGAEYMYRLTHANHPCAKWVRESRQNYEWLADLGLELCREYTHRYGKVHRTQPMIERLRLDVPALPANGRTEWKMAMPDHCKLQSGTVDSYRNYYILEKSHIAKWKNRDAPSWFASLN